MKVLLVDDEADNGMLMALQNHFPEREFVSVSSLDGALSLAERERPDVALIDLYVPPKGGFEIIRQLRRQYTNLTIVAISQDGRFADDALTCGANRFLLKWRFNEFADSLAEVI